MGAGVKRCGLALTGAGLTVLVIGTFLPWLRAGPAARDSYESIAALHGPLASGNRPMVTLLDCWLANIPVLAVGLALYVLRLRRTALIVICVVCAWAGVVSAFLIVGGEGGPVLAVSAAGPAVTLVGAVLALAGGVLVIMSTPVGSQ